MKPLVIKNLNWFLGGLILLFLMFYLLFSSLSTSLDFKIEQLLPRKAAAQEEYGQLVSVVAQAQNKETLVSAAAGLGLKEVTLADGYLDIRPVVLSAANALVIKGP